MIDFHRCKLYNINEKNKMIELSRLTMFHKTNKQKNRFVKIHSLSLSQINHEKYYKKYSEQLYDILMQFTEAKEKFKVMRKKYLLQN